MREYVQWMQAGTKIAFAYPKAAANRIRLCECTLHVLEYDSVEIIAWQHRKIQTIPVGPRAGHLQAVIESARIGHVLHSMLRKPPGNVL